MNETNVKKNGDTRANGTRFNGSRFVKPREITRLRGSLDRPLLILIILMLSFGLVMVFSASYAEALTKKGDSYYYIKRQLAFSLGGIALMLIVSLIDYRLYKNIAVPLFIGVSILLVLTPIYGFARGIARRWIYIGPVRLQPSELMKATLVFMLAWYFSVNQDRICDYTDFRRSSRYGILIPYIIVAFVCFLILVENHFSCLILMFIIGTIIIFVGGGRKMWFAVAGGVGIAAIGLLISVSSYARSRLGAFLHPENYSADDELYQSLQGLYAVGSGGFLGVGLGNSRQKHLFVSEPQNDFIFSIICEELGFVGALAVILLFLLFIIRGVQIAMRAPDTFSSLVAVGLTGKVAAQAFLNMAVVTGMAPNTGISLPFFSYGGTALLVQLAEMGVLLSISRYTVKDELSE